MGSNDPERWFDGPRGESGANATGATTGLPRAGRRRFVQGALATGVALPGVASADGGGPNVDVEFLDCVTVAITGDVGEITSLHFHVWNDVEVFDDYALVYDMGSLSVGETVGLLRVQEYDPGAGTLVLSLNSIAYNYLIDAHVYFEGDPDHFGAGGDVSKVNPYSRHVALDDLDQDTGTYVDGNEVSAEVTLANVSEETREVFLGYSAVGPDGLAFTNGGTTGTAVTIEPDETDDEGINWTTETVTVNWEVESDAPNGTYDAHVAVWQESDPANLQTKYDERYFHDAFTVGETVGASIDDVSLPDGTFDDGDAVETDVTVENTGATDRTFFVGYSVLGPDDLAYTNGGTTGTPVSLASGDSATVTVGWTVESDAPAGYYGVHVALWREDDPDALETKLDEKIDYTVFEVA